MVITDATRKVVIDHAVATLGRAPSAAELAAITKLLNNNASLADVADYLTSSEGYLAKYPLGQTAKEIGADILDAAIVGGVLAADIRLAAIDIIAGGLTAGTYTIASATNAVVAFLSNTANNANTDFGDIAKAFQNRTAAAEEFTTTFTLEGVTVTEADLAAAVEGVTSDAATLTAAKAAFAAGSKSIAEQAAADKAVADAAAAKAAEEKAAADKVAADKAAADKAAADAAAAEKVLTDAYTAAAAEAATAIAASEAADAALIAAQTASEAAATKAALTDATALTAATTAATAADTAAKAAVVAATTAYEAALVAGVAADVSTANGSLLIANNNAAVAAAALVTATAASDAATADDTAAATAATALAAATTASDTAAAAADAAAAAAVTAAAATADTDDDTAAAVLVTEAAASNPTGDAAVAAAAAAKAAADKVIADQAAADKAAADKAAADKAIADQAAADKAAADKVIADAAAAAEALKQTIALTTGIDTKEGGVADDTFVASATTFSVGDNLTGGEGSDTLAISDVADAMSAVPASVTLDSIEKITIATSGDLGVTASGNAAVAQIDKITFPSVVADVQQVTDILVGATTAADGNLQVTYNGNTVTYVNDSDKPGTNITKIVEAINNAAGSTVAYAGVAKVNVAVANVAAGASAVSFTNANAAGIRVGMTVTSSDAGSIAAGTRVTAVDVGATNTVVTLSAAIPANQDIDADGDTLTFGGGPGSATAAGGITLYGATDGVAKSISFSAPTGLSTSIGIAGVAGNQGTIVNFTYGGQSGQYTIGSTNDATATAFAAALNAVASDATAAVVDSGTSDYVTLTSGTAGTALKDLVFVSAGANASTVTTTTANVANTAVAAAAYDVSGLTTEAVVVTLADSANLKASTGDNVTVSGVTGAITVNGGLAVTVTDATANKAIDLDNAKGAVVVTDTKQGTAAIGVGEGTNVDVTASSVSTGTVIVGDSATAISGSIKISSTGSAYATTTANTTLGAITTTSGTTVDVTQSATSSTAAAAADTTATTITQSAVTVNAGNSTTAITVTQDAVATANNAVTGIAAKAAAHVITFTGAAAGDVITLTEGAGDTVVFTAAKALTAAQVANAFANLAKNALAGSAPATDGVYTSGGTVDEGWYSGGVTVNATGTLATVTFNNATATATITSIANAGTGTATLGAVVAGTAATLAETGVMGVGTGAIDINGASVKDAVTEVTLTNFASSNIESDVLSTLNLTGSAGNTVVSTASVGSVTANLNGITGNITLDSGTATVTGLTINASGKKVDSQVTADVVTALTINAGVAVDLTNSSFAKATSMTVTGAGTVTLDGDAGTSVLAAVDASQATGSVNASGVALTAAGIYTGGSGADTFTVTASATKASTGGAGNDVITVSTFATGGSVDAGDGIDTLVMAASDAANADANTLFAQNLANFEVLALGVLGTENIVTSNLGLNSLVVTNGTTGAATVSGLAADATVTINAAITTSLTAALAVATGTSDVINLSTNIDGDLTAGTVIIGSVETVNLSAVDKFVDVSGSFDAFGNAIPNGVDDTNSAQTISLDIDDTTTLNITGSADLTVDILDNTGANNANAITTTLVDASAFTGKFTLIADGAVAGTTVKGGSGVDTLTADGSNDTLIGNAGNDKLVGTLLTTLTGGAGNDTFVIETVTALTTYSTITDLSSGDVIDTTATNFRTTAVTLAAASTFVDYANEAIKLATGSNGADGAAWFQFGGNTFLAVEGTTGAGDTYLAGEDVIVQITGLVDLSAAAFNATTGELTI